MSAEAGQGGAPPVTREALRDYRRAWRSVRARRRPPPVAVAPGPASSPVTPAGEKRCPRCGETRVVDDFSICRHRADGRQCYCKPCMYAAQGRRAPCPA